MPVKCTDRTIRCKTLRAEQILSKMTNLAPCQAKVSKISRCRSQDPEHHNSRRRRMILLLSWGSRLKARERSSFRQRKVVVAAWDNRIKKAVALTRVRAKVSSRQLPATKRRSQTQTNLTDLDYKMISQGSKGDLKKRAREISVIKLMVTRHDHMTVNRDLTSSQS